MFPYTHLQSTNLLQIGFITFIVKPLYTTWVQYLPPLTGLLDNIEKNENYWKSEKERKEKANLRKQTLASDKKTNTFKAQARDGAKEIIAENEDAKRTSEEAGSKHETQTDIPITIEIVEDKQGENAEGQL